VKAFIQKYKCLQEDTAKYMAGVIMNPITKSWHNGAQTCRKLKWHISRVSGNDSTKKYGIHIIIISENSNH